MSEVPPPAETPAEEKPWNKPRQKVSEKTRIALLACIESARFAKLSNGRLQALAIQCGVKYSTLKQTWYRWNKGLIDLGEPETPEEKSVEAKVEMMRTMEFCVRTEKFHNDWLEGAMVRVREETAAGNTAAYFQHGVDRVVNAMLQLARLREVKERGFLAIMESARQDQDRLRQENVRDAKVIDVTPKRIEKATDLQKLDAAFAAAPETVTVPA